MITKRFYFPLLFLTAFHLISSCSIGTDGNSSSRERRALSVEYHVIRTEPLVQLLSLSGTLMAGEEVELRAETTGKLVEFHIEEGRTVQQGQLLARLNDSEQRARLARLEADLKLAQDDLTRMQRLKEINALSQQDLDAAKNRVDGINADIQLVRAQIEKAEVRAPFDGRIGLRNVSPGAFIGPNTVLATLVQFNPLRLEFSVPERYAFGVSDGKEVTYTLGHSPKEYKAKVYATESIIDQQTRALRVRAMCPNPSGELIPGSFARVSFKVNGNLETILIPPHALVPVLGGQQVVVTRGGRAHFVPVEIGIRTATEVEIVSGVQPGDTLLTSGLLQVREGMAVELIQD